MPPGQWQRDATEAEKRRRKRRIPAWNMGGRRRRASPLSTPRRPSPTPAVARAITAQGYSELFVNYKGVMFGNGRAWINGVCEDTACGDAQARVVAIQPVQ
jgi:hypothetical protein